jgi:GntR family transcriptional regulator
MTATLPMTKHHQIYVVLLEQLIEGQFSAGLPGELALMQQFGVARITVRRALEQLAAEDLISRESARGTRVLPVGGSRFTLRDAHMREYNTIVLSDGCANRV